MGRAHGNCRHQTEEQVAKSNQNCPRSYAHCSYRSTSMSIWPATSSGVLGPRPTTSSPADLPAVEKLQLLPAMASLACMATASDAVSLCSCLWLLWFWCEPEAVDVVGVERSRLSRFMGQRMEKGMCCVHERSWEQVTHSVGLVTVSDYSGGWAVSAVNNVCPRAQMCVTLSNYVIIWLRAKSDEPNTI